MPAASRSDNASVNTSLEVRDFRLVAAVCAEGTLTKAGARLHVTQPALSRHLATLETRIGTSLFTRKGARMHPTPSGELLLRRAREVLERIQETETELRGLTKSPQRTLRVGVDCYTGYHWLPRVVNRYAARHPAIDVQIAFEAIRSPARRSSNSRRRFAKCRIARSRCRTCASPSTSAGSRRMSIRCTGWMPRC